MSFFKIQNDYAPYGHFRDTHVYLTHGVTQIPMLTRFSTETYQAAGGSYGAFQTCIREYHREQVQAMPEAERTKLMKQVERRVKQLQKKAQK